eukprot:TRINITY_DN23366_c2_g1_i1.p1 TRINITY_DN23366_c2_g1~~TRINITY_DN23366_c2_g1_i1.p1  ORF type:complete len:222 (+),score=18.78 TRINITY_DN23366_c2_g1_i1:650-1315(+)
MKTSFENDFFSKQYIWPKKVQENELQSFFETGELSYVSVQLESSDRIKEIKVQGQVWVKNFQATNAGNGLSFLKISLQNYNSSIVLEDSKFENVGVLVGGVDNNQSVAFENVNIQNAPVDGIRVINCKTCVINSSRLDNCGGEGVFFFNVNNYILQEVDVKGCWRSGVCCVQNYKGDMTVGTLGNCSALGINVSSGCGVNGQNVTFNNNQRGITVGNYSQI